MQLKTQTTANHPVDQVVGHMPYFTFRVVSGFGGVMPITQVKRMRQRSVVRLVQEQPAGPGQSQDKVPAPRAFPCLKLPYGYLGDTNKPS